MVSKYLGRVKSVVRSGGIIAYPTEAVYGIGCDPRNANALKRIVGLKCRTENKGFIIIAANCAQLKPYLGQLSKNELWLLKQPRRVPTTWVCPVNKFLPYAIRRWLVGNRNTIAVRITTHNIAQTLCRNLGHALVSTSANKSGHSPLKSAIDVRRQFKHSVDLVVTGKVGDYDKPSSIYDIRTGDKIR